MILMLALIISTNMQVDAINKSNILIGRRILQELKLFLIKDIDRMKSIFKFFLLFFL